MKILKEKINEILKEFDIYNSDLPQNIKLQIDELIHKVTNTYEEELIKSLRCPECVGKLQLENNEDENYKIIDTTAQCRNCGFTIII